MKRTILALILACSTLALTAQGTIKVNYKGAKPSISDFAWAVLSMDENSEEVDFDESLLEGRVCYGGLDLSSTTDITLESSPRSFAFKSTPSVPERVSPR